MRVIPDSRRAPLLLADGGVIAELLSDADRHTRDLGSLDPLREDYEISPSGQLYRRSVRAA